ncbi:Aste57867_18555 [Aphanomyces stellatus]|uniref:Aste57867_18555 protein n=1 Tax=Aphanomyces stellatus TaxID=120398 RepID=A0A485LAE5_9STRA|nr:hypothetical protein As57867_018493 [Aphanomyces stellatus]VFT95291.1 Aste57867_18555 [Aphanomyces stellatus]
MSRTEAERAARRKRYLANRADVLAQQKEYRQNNKGRIAVRAKRWYLQNKDRMAQYKKEYQQQNKERIAARKKAYTERNKDRIAAAKSAYYHATKAKNKRRPVEPPAVKTEAKAKLITLDPSVATGVALLTCIRDIFAKDTLR